MEKIATVKSKSSRKPYKTIINKTTKYLKKYENGVPRSDLQKIATDLNLDFTVELPFKRKILTAVRTERRKFGKKHFKYINSRYNHLDIMTCNYAKEELIGLLMIETLLLPIILWFCISTTKSTYKRQWLYFFDFITYD